MPYGTSVVLPGWCRRPARVCSSPPRPPDRRRVFRGKITAQRCRTALSRQRGVLDVLRHHNGAGDGIEPALSAWELYGAARLPPGDSTTCGDIGGLTVSDRDYPQALLLSGTQRARRPLRPKLAAPWSSSPSSELRITRVFSCVARGLKARASFMFAGGCRWRSLAVDGSSGASRGHAPVVRRPGSRRGGAVERPSAFQAGHIPSWRGSCKCYALSPVAGGSRWLLLLLSPAGPVPHFRGLPADDSVTPWSSSPSPGLFPATWPRPVRPRLLPRTR
jgi:hypothetical protein